MWMIPSKRKLQVRYAHELRKKRCRAGLFRVLELAQVKHQAMKMSGRRGEQIKHEEINKEILGRQSLPTNQS